MKKYHGLMYDCPRAELVPAEVASILCQSDLTIDANINYNNPFGDSEGLIS